MKRLLLLCLCLITPLLGYSQTTTNAEKNLAFGIPFTVSDGTNNIDLTVGVDPDGQSSFVEGLDVLAPPPPPDGAFDARIKVAGTSYFQKYLDNALTEKTFNFEYVAASGNGPITFSWDPDLAETVANITVTDAFGGAVYSADLSTFDGSFTPSTASPVLASSFVMKLTPTGNEPPVDETPAETPVFDPAGGSYTGSVEVSISSATAGAMIYYTTDGSTPDASSTEYSGPITFTETTALKAIATADGFLDSDVAEATYTIEGDEPPAGLAFGVPFTVSDGTNNIDLTVGVDPDGQTAFVEGLDVLAPPPPPDGAFDARIKVAGTSYFQKYLDNALTEKTFNFEYVAASGNGPITFSWDPDLAETVASITVTDAFGGAVYSADLSTFGGSFTPSTASPVLANGFVMKLTPTGNEPPVDETPAETPVFDPAGGSYTGSVEVSISSATANAMIYYTTDGSTPDASSTEYSGPITFTETTTLKAIATADGFLDSDVAEATYTIEPDEPPAGLAFGIPFTVSDGTNDIDLTVGVDPDGQSSFVEGLDVLAPPPPPDGAFDARIKVAGTSYFQKYLDNALTEKTFNFEYVAASGNGPITFTWDPDLAETVSSITITDTFGGTIFSVDLSTLGGSFTPSTVSPLLASGFVMKLTPTGNEPPVDETPAETPVFDPAGGSYTGSVEVSISSSTAGAMIYYTTDGSTPDASSTEYSGPITFIETTTLKAIATADGFLDSDVAEATYTIEPDEPPSGLAWGITFVVDDGVNDINLIVGIDPNGQTDFVEGLDIIAPPPPPDGAFDARVKVNNVSYFEKYLENTLTEKTFRFEYVAAAGNGPITFSWNTNLAETVANITITDTFGGSVYSEDLSSFDGSFTPSTASPILADGFIMLVTPTGNEPPVVEPVAETPVFNPAGGTFTESVEVSISSATADAMIYYTTDGSTPGVSSTEYTGPVTFTETTTLKAIAIAEGFEDSDVAEATYTIEGDEPEGLAFGIPFTVSDGVNDIDLTVGVHPNGQLDFVEGLDAIAPPPPPDGAFDARIKVNNISYFEKYLENTLTEKTFSFEYVAAAGNGPITFTWNTNLAETVASITVTDAFGGSVYSEDLTTFGGSFTPSEANAVLASGFVMLLTPTGNEPPTEEPIAETPVFDPAGGSFTDNVEVSITSGTAGATIYYTTDGTTPSDGSNEYTGTITLTQTTTLRAIAVADGFQNSAIASANYVVTQTPVAATPSFSPSSGTYLNEVEVMISTATTEATIYYTTDGSTPDAGANVYSDALMITETTTIKAIAIAEGFNDSEIAEATYNIVSDELAFSVVFNVSDGSNDIDLTVGIDPNGMVDFVDGLDQLAPPAPPDGAFDGRIKVGGVSYFKKFLDNSITEKTFNFEYTAAAGNGPITFTWDNSGLSDLGTFTVQDTFGGAIYSQDLTGFDGTFVPSSASPLLASGFVLKILPNEGEPTPVADAPDFDPAGGTFTDEVTVTISSDTESATIYYTTDGSDPTAQSAVYNSPVTFTETTTLKAIAIADGFLNSEITEALYTIVDEPVAETPMFDPTGGTYTNEVVVTITSSTSSATIYYTTDGSTPDGNATEYNGAFAITETTTIKAIAIATGFQNSNVAEAEYTIVYTPGNVTLQSPADGATDVSQMPTFEWSESSNADTYSLQVATDASFETLIVDETDLTGNSLTIEEMLEQLTEHFWRVRGENAQGSGSWSATFSFTTQMGTSIEDSNLPTVFALEQNYPNPFNPSTQIRYQLPEIADVKLEVYNLLGQQLTVLADGKQTAGTYEVTFDASNLTTGIYIIRLTANNFVQTRKMMLMK